MSGDRVTSAPKEQRAAELTRMLLDPAIRAVVPPWGGELAIDLLDQLDWLELATAEPTWTVGYSDSTAWMLPITLRLGWAAIHGTNLMETPYVPEDGLLHWADIASLPAGSTFTQHSPGRYRSGGHDDWEGDPGVSRMTLDASGTWSVLGGGAVDVTGRLVGGCLEILTALAGTPYGDVGGFGRAHADEGLIVFVEACEYPAYDIARILHGLRLAGWFDDADAVLVGRTHAPRVRRPEPARSRRRRARDAGHPGRARCRLRPRPADAAARERGAGAGGRRRQAARDHPDARLRRYSWMWSRQSSGTRPAGPGTGWSTGRQTAGASSGPRKPDSVV